METSQWVEGETSKKDQYMNKKTYELVEAHTKYKTRQVQNTSKKFEPEPLLPPPPFYPFFTYFSDPSPENPYISQPVHLHRCCGEAERPHRTRSPRSRRPGVWDGKRHEAPEECRRTIF